MGYRLCGLRIERVEDGGRFAMAHLEAMPAGELAERFLPGQAASGGDDRRLFALRWTRCGGGDVLGLRVSHAAVDGTGLGWFARCCTAGARGAAPPRVCHDRDAILAAAGHDSVETPAGYRDAGACSATWQWPPDPWANGTPVYFMIHASAARNFPGLGGSLLETRLALRRQRRARHHRLDRHP